uniref:Capsid protein n=1 Tax=Rosellinia necatrix partitivirus 17 TaxID=2699385 RepID=A0A6F8QGN1_9VIRU|nr:capsid protein [Rosellinia necatrix partitivirus 17]
MPDTPTEIPPRDVVAETPPAPGAKKTLGTTKRSAPDHVSVSLAAILDLESDVHKGKGTYHSGSFVPDTRFFVLAVSTFIGRVFSATDFEASQFVTPPSLIAYYLLCLYFLLFYRDMHSKSPSLYARNFTDFARYNQLLKMMDNVYIPDEIFAILTNFVSFAPDLVPNLQFVPTLASAILEYDAGYLLHPAIFMHGHNTLFNRADALGHHSRFLKCVIANLSLSNGNDTIAARNYRVSNFLGCVYSNGAAANDARLVQNWLSRVILPFVDPATHRQHLRRTGISKFDLGVPTFTSANWNPYQYLFSSTVSSSFESTLDCIHACSEFSRDQLKASKTMSQLYTASNPAPGSYMIMAYSTPTWHTVNIPDNNFPDGEVTPGAFATLHDNHTLFGIAPTAATTNANNLTMPQAILTGPQAAQTTFVGAGGGSRLHGFLNALYLAEAHQDPDTALPAQLTLDTRNDMKHTAPDTLVFAPSDATVSAAQHPMLAGIVVHNGNIDSTIVRTPNPTDELPMIRSRYIDGFVSLRVIRPRFMARPTWLIARQALERMSYNTINLLWRSDMIGLPRYDASHNAPNAGGAANLFWPFTFFRRVTQMLFGTNVAVSDPPVEPTNTAWMQVGDAWSSFRLSSDSNARPSARNTFFGINHGEVIFGRNSTLNKFSHPSDLLRRN